MSQLYLSYVHEKFNEKGELTEFKLTAPDTFNFAYDVVDQLAKSTPNAVAMVWCNESGEEHTFTFSDMKRESDKAASFFLEQGIRKGDFVLMILKRHYQFWFAVNGLHKIGAVGIPATNQLLVKDLIYRMNSADVKAVICTADGDISDFVDLAQESCPTLEIKIIVKGEKSGWGSFENGCAKAKPFIKPTGEDYPCGTDPMLLYFSSGTTGMPKMVLLDFFYPLGHIPTAAYWHNIKPGKLHFTVSETGWAKSVWGKIYGQWIMEAPIFAFDFDRFNANDMLEKIQKYKIATFCAPPTIYRFLIKEDLSRFDLSSLEHVTTAGEALNAEVYQQFLKNTGLKLMEGFGQTETTLALATFRWMDTKPGSMGVPSPLFDIALVNENNETVNDGEVGQISIRTHNGVPYGMFHGYFKDQEMTDNAWYDNVYHTGDMATRDEDGFYWYVGRADDIIKSSGYRIGPFEVESVIMEHPSVLECAVTGTPDPLRGQAVKATIVLAKGYTPSKELMHEIQEHVKTQTAPYKYPRVIEFVTELPKTISGKIRRTEIRERDN
ncbi:MAG: AMP-binding protein [Clostridia bacterium]